MGTRDPRVDAYIAKSAPFARPILERLRELVHETCPGVVETIKWRQPAFEYEGPLCGMGAFKAHCVFGFWKHDLLIGDDEKAKEAMGSFGRLTSVTDLPSRTRFAAWMKRARKLNDDGVKVVRAKTRPKRPVPLHPDFERALARDGAARATLEAFPPSRRAEYVEWIASAKGDDTRARRIAQACQWLAEGKRRNWKYERSRS